MTFWHDNEAIIESVHPLDASIAEDMKPDWLEEFCGDSGSAARGAFNAIPALSRLLEGGNYPTEEEVIDALSWPPVHGFLVKVRWCRRTYKGSGIFMSGPGLTTWRWVYDDNLDVAIERAKSIVEADHEAQRRKAA